MPLGDGKKRLYNQLSFSIFTGGCKDPLLGYQVASDAGECQRICDAHSLCRWFTFSQNLKMCSLLETCLSRDMEEASSVSHRLFCHRYEDESDYNRNDVY